MGTRNVVDSEDSREKYQRWVWSINPQCRGCQAQELASYLDVTLSDGQMPLDATRAEFYALVTGETIEQFQLRGWASNGMLTETSSIIDLGHGPCFGLAQRQLVSLAKAIIKTAEELS